MRKMGAARSLIEIVKKYYLRIVIAITVTGQSNLVCIRKASSYRCHKFYPLLLGFR